MRHCWLENMVCKRERIHRHPSLDRLDAAPVAEQVPHMLGMPQPQLKPLENIRSGDGMILITKRWAEIHA